jgi:hypothetical protein
VLFVFSNIGETWRYGTLSFRGVTFNSSFGLRSIGTPLVWLSKAANVQSIRNVAGPVHGRTTYDTVEYTF